VFSHEKTVKTINNNQPIPIGYFYHYIDNSFFVLYLCQFPVVGVFVGKHPTILAKKILEDIGKINTTP